MGAISTVCFALLGGGLLAFLLRGHLQLGGSIHRPAVPPLRRSHYPSITVIRPIRGLDPGCRENTLALLNQVYPGTRQTIFVFDSNTDPAWAVVKEAVRDSINGRDARLLVAGPPPPERT